jgi:hypothetical protein
MQDIQRIMDFMAIAIGVLNVELKYSLQASQPPLALAYEVIDKSV